MKKGIVYWITGLSGAGKTTLGSMLYQELKSQKNDIVRLDGDELREIINNKDYTYEGRKEVAFQYARFCRMLSEQGIDVVICTVSMYDEVRIWGRQNISHYCEIYVKVPMEDLIKRNQKQLYSRALKREIRNVIGVDVDFEEPKQSEIVVENSNDKCPNQSYAEMMMMLKEYWSSMEEMV